MPRRERPYLMPVVYSQTASTRMTKTIRSGRSAYLPLGIIAGGIVVLWIFVWMYRGPQTGAWQPIMITAFFYILWSLMLWRRVLIIDDDGILCTYLTRKPRRVEWSNIRHSVITFWSDGQPFQILVFGSVSGQPLLDIPLKFYDKSDVEFLMSLERLKLAHSSR